jgi:branched-chain amino acid transport system substrate-binding protein
MTVASYSTLSVERRNFDGSYYVVNLTGSAAIFKASGLLAIVLLLLMSACGRDSDKTIVVGGVLPLTGDAATFGQNASRGAQLALSQASKSGLLAQRTIVWKVEDSRGVATQAVSAVRKLIDVDGATLLIGDVTSAGTHAIIPIITEQKRPLISPAASDPKLSNSSPYFARVWPSDVYEAEVIGNYAIQQKYSRTAIVYANTDYGVGMVDAFRKIVPPNLIDLVIPVERETLDYRPTIKRIQLAGASSIFLVVYPEDARRFLQQLDELRVSLPILATATFEDPKLLAIPPSTKVVFSAPAPPSDSDKHRKAFIDSYTAMFREAPGVLSDTAYDAANILIEAYAKQGSRGPEAVMGYIKSLKDYAGVSGKLSIDQAGDVRKEYRLRTVRAGKFDWLN